jgi:hypothetical protein
MFMCVVNQKAVNKLDLTWKQSFLIIHPIESALCRHSKNLRLKAISNFHLTYFFLASYLIITVS